MKLDTYHEPVRLAAVVVGATTALGNFFLQWAQGGDWRVAVGASLLSFALVWGGGEAARLKAYAPATFDETVSAEDVIRRAERGDGG